MYYLIKYEESVENRVAIALTENPQNEIAVLALADYEDETISIDEIYCILSEGQTDLAAKINMEDQMKLIKYCEKNNKIPVVTTLCTKSNIIMYFCTTVRTNLICCFIFNNRFKF